MNKSRFLFIFLVIVAIIFVVVLLNRNCRGIKCLVFQDSSEFTLTDTYENSADTFRALYQKGNDTYFRLEVKGHVEKADSSKLLSSKIAHLNDIFENSISPYPGEISVKISCADKYKPKLTQSDRLPYFIAYLNDRLQFGSCSEDQVKNQGAIAFLYCSDQKKFYQIEYITSVQKNEDKTAQIKSFVESISCKPNNPLFPKNNFLF